MPLSCGDKGGVFLWSAQRETAANTHREVLLLVVLLRSAACGSSSEDLHFHNNFDKQLTATK